MSEPADVMVLDRCPRCRYATEGLDGTTCPECGASVLGVRRDGYSAEGVRWCTGRAGVVTGLNVLAAVLLCVLADYWLFLAGVVVCAFLQVGCFLVTMAHLPDAETVRADFEIKRWVGAGLVVNIAGFVGCGVAVVARLVVFGGDVWA